MGNSYGKLKKNNGDADSHSEKNGKGGNEFGVTYSGGTFGRFSLGESSRGKKKITATERASCEQLAKILHKRTGDEMGINGIMPEIFSRFVFPEHDDMAERLFDYFRGIAKVKHNHLTTSQFRSQCERFMVVIDEFDIVECFLKMYANDGKMETMTPNDLNKLLQQCFKLSMLFTSNDVKYCTMSVRTLGSITASCFFIEESTSKVMDIPLTKSASILPVNVIHQWFKNNHCLNLMKPIHRYCVWMLSMGYCRHLKNVEPLMMNTNNVLSHLQLSTPILDTKQPIEEDYAPLMPLSQAWVLASALPLCYVKPKVVPPIQQQQQQQQQQSSSTKGSVNAHAPSTVAGSTVGGPTVGGGVVPSSSTSSANNQNVMNNALPQLLPTHWTLLYDSRLHGLGANRFLHHVTGYKGPTLCLFKTSMHNNVYCVGSPREWIESHLYNGDENCCVIQLLPKFVYVEVGAKLLYLNTSIRGYPKGLKVGSDYKKPYLSINEDFETLTIEGTVYDLHSIEVWGCGDQHSREVQLEIKKWQIKEAERQRNVKFTAADWANNPDRYLLELGGRPQYNNNNN